MLCEERVENFIMLSSWNQKSIPKKIYVYTVLSKQYVIIYMYGLSQ
jgi:hypothetical protein